MSEYFFRARYALMISGLIVSLSGCHRTSAETRIQQAIHAGAKAAANTDASRFDALLTDDFSSQGEDLDRRSLINLLRLARLRHESVHALVGSIDLERRGQRWVASFSVTLTSGGRLLPSDIGVYKVTSGWRLDGRHWRCYSASWRH